MIREATIEDAPRLIELAARFLRETQYGGLFKETTPGSILGLILQCLQLGTIIVAEHIDNPQQRWYQQQLDALPDEAARTKRLMEMSTTQKAILIWGDDYGPTKATHTLVGMLAIVVIPHPLSGQLIAEELAWWVEPEHRKGLLGPKMLRAAEEWATRKSANVVKMVAPAGSTVGAFYEKSGYQPVETAYIKTI